MQRCDETIDLAMAMREFMVGVPLWLVTRHGAAVDEVDQPVLPRWSAVWGLGRVLAVEQPDSWVGLVDLPELVDERVAARLAAVLAQHRESQIAIRSTETLGRRIVPAPGASGPDRRRWRADGAVLVTGAGPELVAPLARWVTGRGAGSMVVATTSADLRRACSDTDAPVDVVDCDPADRSTMATLLAGLAGTLEAVVHVAGTEDDAALGVAWNLHELTETSKIADFVLLAPAAGVVGLPGRAADAVTGGLLDSVVAHRRAAGLPALLAASAAWTGSTEAVQDTAAVPLTAALSAVGQALETGVSVVYIARIPGTPQEAEEREDPGQPGAGSLRARLAASPGTERGEVLLAAVRSHAATVLGHADLDAVDPGADFFDLGFASITAVELTKRLATDTGLVLPPALVYDYPTSIAVSDYLAEQLSHVLTNGEHVLTNGEHVLTSGEDLPDRPQTTVKDHAV
jgi:type I polyketide synthase AVES